MVGLWMEWRVIPDHFSFVELGEFIVMPNHMHGIVIIDRPGNDPQSRIGYVPPKIVHGPPGTHPHTTRPDSNAATDADHPPPGHDGIPDGDSINNIERWKPGTLGVIMNQYKRKCTIEARTIRKNFGWQSRFHDHIIRDAAEFRRISEYIRNNPSNWKKDRFYKR